MMCVAIIVGLPVFFEVGFVLLIPIAFNVAKRTGKSLLLIGLPMVAGDPDARRQLWARPDLHAEDLAERFAAFCRDVGRRVADRGAIQFLELRNIERI